MSCTIRCHKFLICIGKKQMLQCILLRRASRQFWCLFAVVLESHPFVMHRFHTSYLTIGQDFKILQNDLSLFSTSGGSSLLLAYVSHKMVLNKCNPGER